MYKKINYAIGDVASTTAIGATTLTLKAGHTITTDTGATNKFIAVFYDGTKSSPYQDTNREIVEAYRTNTNDFVIARAKENTSAKEWVENDKFMLIASAGVFNEYETELDSKQAALGYTPENASNKKTDLTDNSDTYYPTQKAVKTALENHTNLEIHAEAGVHGIRRYEDKLEYWNGTRWVEIKAFPYKIYGVEIDLTNNNPLTSVSYTDDAIGMTAGSSNWDSIDVYKNIKPCVLKNGVLQYYLDPTDFTKKADGSASDITSGDDGDVMIEIPKMGYSIETEGDTLKIKITDNPNDPNFKYYAHSRDSEGDRENLYIGAYLGWYDGTSKLRSISGKTPTANQTIGTFRTQAQANGAGYDQISFYPLTLLQCLYLVRYKSLDSQTALGRGYVEGNSSATATGGANAKGMYFGETTGKQQMKFAGIEDFWGNLYFWIDGLFSNSTRNILTAFKSFNNAGSGYIDNGQGATANIEGYMSKPQGGNGTGFVLKEYGGSNSTYFCDYGRLSASRLPYFGGGWSYGSAAGAFSLNVYYSASDSRSFIGGRLMYLSGTNTGDKVAATSAEINAGTDNDKYITPNSLAGSDYEKNPMTTAGDIIYGGTNGAPTRLAKGTDGKVLTSVNGIPSWADAGTANALPLAGGTMTGGIVLATGSTTIAPIKMVAGTNLTTPVAGVMEFDGTDLFFTI